MKIRPIAPIEVDKVDTLEYIDNGCITSNIYDILSCCDNDDTDLSIYGAYIDDILVGIIDVSEFDSHPVYIINGITVSKDHRYNSIARKLIEYVVDILDIKTLYAKSISDCISGFYIKLGFNDISNNDELLFSKQY